MIENVNVALVDCDQCLREERVETRLPGAMIPEGWLEVTEGAPFNIAFQFCSTDCFLAWHQRDQNERVNSWYTRKRERDAALNAEATSILPPPATPPDYNPGV